MLTATPMASPMGPYGGKMATCFVRIYRFSSPASILANDQHIAVAKDLVTRYDIDGIHLDHIRYPELKTSCDPVSRCRFNGFDETCESPPACVIDIDYKNWQREPGQYAGASASMMK